jgi:hypothetical protein
VARVANAVDQAIKAADAGMSDAERQLAAAAKQVELLTTINGSVMSVHDAILAASDNWAASLAMPSSAYSGAGAGTQSSDIGELKAEISDLKAALAGKLDDIASTNKKTSDLLTRVEDQGSIAISKRGNRTLSVTVDGNVAVVNPTEAGEPVPLTTVAA